MFDIGFSELLVIGLVAFFLLDAKDVPKVIRFIKKFIKEINSYFAEIKEFFMDFEQETKKVIDDQGKEHIAYDLDEIMPNIIEKEKDVREKEKDD